jgi:hypothetical protein
MRRGGRIVEADGRVVTWSMAEGARGRRWRWTVVDRRGAFLAAHTVELEPDGRFARLESAAAGGLLALHAEDDGSLHGNRVVERGIDHLTVPPPAPGVMLVGSGPIGAAIAGAGLRALGDLATPFDVVEVGDDLGVRVVEASARRQTNGTFEILTGLGARRVRLDDTRLPVADDAASTSWPLERA